MIKITFKCDKCGSNDYMVDTEDEVYFHCQECGELEKVFKEDNEDTT